MKSSYASCNFPLFCKTELTSKFGSVGSAKGFGKLFSTEGNCNNWDGRANDDGNGGTEDEVVVASSVVTLAISFDHSDANEFTPGVVSSKDSKSMRLDGQRVTE